MEVYCGGRFRLHLYCYSSIDMIQKRLVKTMKWKKILCGCLATISLFVAGCNGGLSSFSGNTVKVGLLHSLSGTMAISEVPVIEAEKLAIEEINASGGVLGKQIEIIEEDGLSDPRIFAEKARMLLTTKNVATIFGCWTSASRKAVIPIMENENALLWYPVQYEGMENTKNVVYTGSTMNQQIIPAVDYLLKNGKKRMFLIGSDYIFPHTANKIIKAQLSAMGGECVGEEYTPLGHTDYAGLIERIKAIHPDVIINTLNGDTNVNFFRQLREAGITATDIPVMSFSIAEIEVQYIGAENVAGHLTAWSYYETLNNPENNSFISAYKRKYGNARLTDDPVEAGYTAVYLWKTAVERANSFDTDAIRSTLADICLRTPEGEIVLDAETQHLYRRLHIGRVREDGMIETIESMPPIKADPYLESYAWAKGLVPAKDE